jgi:hypothetical protein
LFSCSLERYALDAYLDNRHTHKKGKDSMQ